MAEITPNQNNMITSGFTRKRTAIPSWWPKKTQETPMNFMLSLVL